RYLSRPRKLGGARGLLRGPEPRAADLAHRALLVAARRLRLPEAHEPHPGAACGGRAARAHRLGARARRRARRARPFGGVPDEGPEGLTAPHSGRAASHDFSRSRVRTHMAKNPEDIIREDIRALKAYAVP